MKELAGFNNLNMNKHIKNIFYLFLVVNYFFIIAIITMVNLLKMQTVPLFFFEFECSAFCGIMSTMIIVTLVMLTILYLNKGFITACNLYTFYIIYSVFTLFHEANNSIITGLLMVTFGYIICVILHHTFKNLRKNNQLLQQQKNVLNKIAYYDSLTNLPNRHRILSEIENLLKQANENNESFAIIRIDISNYRLLRDYLGHSRGEEELMSFATRLRSVIHPLDMPGRLDSNEFIILVERNISKEELVSYATHLQQDLSHMIVWNNNHYYFTTSLGICIYPEHGTTTEELIQYADTACFDAKHNADDHIALFNRPLFERLAHKTYLENALKDAIANNELYLVFQPQYCAMDKSLRGFETLLRWETPTMGFISPSEFIPIAEETGSILPIGQWVLEQACETFQRIIRNYNIKPMLSVNISAVQLLESSFIDIVKNLLDSTSFPPELLEFEITETVLITNKDNVIRVLNEIKALGIQLALDDFGTEYASLSYLQQLPLDILKIDKSFVNLIGPDSKNEMVDSIITIANHQSLVTVAEGIETEQQLHYLQDKGCQYIQGFLWGKPLREEQVIDLLDHLKSNTTLN